MVTAAELLSVAAFRDGRHAQAFPSFGSERTDAPVVAYCRIDSRPIRTREPVLDPDALIIQDPTLVHRVDVFAGMRRDGYLLLNSRHDLAALGMTDEVLDRARHRACVKPAGARGGGRARRARRGVPPETARHDVTVRDAEEEAGA